MTMYENLKNEAIDIKEELLEAYKSIIVLSTKIVIAFDDIEKLNCPKEDRIKLENHFWGLKNPLENAAEKLEKVLKL
jgi:hypothetical protein